MCMGESRGAGIDRVALCRELGAEPTCLHRFGLTNLRDQRKLVLALVGFSRGPRIDRVALCRTIGTDLRWCFHRSTSPGGLGLTGLHFAVQWQIYAMKENSACLDRLPKVYKRCMVWTLHSPGMQSVIYQHRW